MITSTFGGSSTNASAAPARDAPRGRRAPAAWPTGPSVHVWNDLGEVHLPLRVTDASRRASSARWKGAWLRTSDNGQTVSALVPAHHADLAGGACFNDTRVEVTALA